MLSNKTEEEYTASHVVESEVKGSKFTDRQKGIKSRPYFTGRYILVFRGNSTGDAVKSLKKGSGLRVASSSDFPDRAIQKYLEDGEAHFFEALGVAVVSADYSQVEKIHTSSVSGGTPLIIPERFMFAAGILSIETEYLRGYQDGVKSLTNALTEMTELQLITKTNNIQTASSEFTWGLLATNASKSRYTGEGIKIAVLDTGFDVTHPDFSGRKIITKCFIPGENDVSDAVGHGTHCVGTACGPRSSVEAPAYGCAPMATIYMGKVLGDDGTAEEGWVLNGINWAIENQCDIISLSLECPYDPNYPDLPQYEQGGEKALENGQLIIAAAGNFSSRPHYLRPVAIPACARSIVAVAAVDISKEVATFSCAGIQPGCNIDISGPGVGIESSSPSPKMRKLDSGTSMAAPHVAGVAALHMESDSNLRGKLLWDRLVQSALTIPGSKTDIGAGLVQAP